MTDDTFERRISEVRGRISELPEAQRGPLLVVLEETVQRHYQMRQSFSKLHDALSEWQLMLKYLIFDREATVRERDELRRKLGGQDR